MHAHDGALNLPLTLNFGRLRWSATWFMTALTIAAVVLFINLGRWQWQRAAQKNALDANFSAGTRAVTLLESGSSAMLARYAQVRLQGRYDGAHQFLLDNISHDGQPGYEVLTPLLMADGRSMIVNRGWVPMTASRAQLPPIALNSTAPLAVTGRLDALPVVGISLGHIAPAVSGPWPRLTSFPTMTDLSVALGRTLETRQLLLDADQPLGYLRDWHPSGMAADRHLSYAIQWWLFAALALVLYGYMNRRKAAR